jgi:hypothetical protein
MPNLTRLNDKPLSGPIHDTLTREDSAILACLPYTADIMILADRLDAQHMSDRTATRRELGITQIMMVESETAFWEDTLTDADYEAAAAAEGYF